MGSHPGSGCDVPVRCRGGNELGFEAFGSSKKATGLNYL
jgi:hypothetical protein